MKYTLIGRDIALYILLLPLFTLSFISFDFFGLTVRSLDVSLFILLLLSLCVWAVYPFKIIVFRLSILENITLLHFFFLCAVPVVGFFVYGVIDASLIARWFQVFILALVFFSIFPPEGLSCKSMVNIFLIAGTLNLGYALLMLSEIIGLISIGTLPHHWEFAQHLNWKTDHFMRIPALFSGPNQLGWYALSVALMSIAGMLSTSNELKRGWGFVFIIHFFLLIISTARTAIISFLFVVAVYFILTFFRSLLVERVSRDKQIYLLFSSVLFFSLITFYAGANFNIFRIDALVRAFSVFGGDFGADGSFSNRMEIWVRAIDIYRNNFFPFGTLTTPTDHTGVIDSGWLSYLVQSGPVLTLTFFIMLVVSFFSGIKYFLKRKNWYGLSLAMFSLALAFGQITLSPFHYLPTLALFLLSIALARREHQRSSSF